MVHTYYRGKKIYMYSYIPLTRAVTYRPDTTHSNYKKFLYKLLEDTMAGIAQLVEHPTENPGTILKQVQVPSAAIFSQSQPTCNCMHQRDKNPQHWQPYLCLDTWKHWQEWEELFFLLLCLTKVRQPEFPLKDNEQK